MRSVVHSKPTVVRRALRNSKCYISFAVVMKQDYCELLSVFCSTPRRRVVGRDSSVGLATRYGLDGPGVESRWGARFFAPVRTGPGARPAFYTIGTESFPGVKRPGAGVDHPPHLTQKLKKV